MQKAESVPLLWDKKQLANHLGFSPNHLDVMEREGKLPPSIKCGKSKRWRTSEILQWVSDGCPVTESTAASQP